MPYITREDGEHFVIPSYREVLSARQKSILKKDILLLSQSYGEYITLQLKNPSQYEVAFSPDTGYLLGESIWHQLNKPDEMIYCEAIPNTTEAILVIVKSGSVYLDGSFPLDSITEELIIFLTQQNHFEIYTYGDVPISEQPEEGKFSFDADSVKSFTNLDAPLFPILPLLKNYQLQLVDPLLRAHGIGVFPTKQLAGLLIAIGVIYMGYSILTAPKVEAPPPPVVVNPYQTFNDTLRSPDPTQTIQQFMNNVTLLFTMPGWQATGASCDAKGNFAANIQSHGGTLQEITDWSQANGMALSIKSTGVSLTKKLDLGPNRPTPKKIYPLNDLVGSLLDRMAAVYPGNALTLGQQVNQGPSTTMMITVNFTDASPILLNLIGNLFKDLPFVLQNITLTIQQSGSLNGSLIIEVLGS